MRGIITRAWTTAVPYVYHNLCLVNSYYWLKHFALLSKRKMSKVRNELLPFGLYLKCKFKGNNDVQHS